MKRKRIICGVLCVAILFLTGCAGLYQGFTAIRVKAGKFAAECGPFHKFSGDDVDATFTRDCQITGEKGRKLRDKADIVMGAGKDASLEIRSRGDYSTE